MNLPDYYRILEVSPSASKQDIKAAFKRQAIRWHPDKNPDKDTTKIMQEINEARLILLDDEARFRYDLIYFELLKNREKNQERQSKLKERYNYKENKNDSNGSEGPTSSDELLNSWVKNARNQAIKLAEQAIIDFRGVAVAGFSAGFRSMVQTLLMILVLSFLYFVISLLLK